jgi:hypothetical protein
MNNENNNKHITSFANPPFKEVNMATNNFRKLVVFGSIVAMLLLAASMLSCDKRHAVNKPDQGETQSGIGNVLITLKPIQIHLSSPEDTDTAQVVIAVVDSSGVGVPNIRVRVTRNPNIGFLTQPDSTDAQGLTSATFIAEPGIYDIVTIFATAGNITKSAELVISGPSRYTLNLTYSPPVPKLIDHEADPYTVTANLVDSTQRGISGQQVTFAVLNEVGRLGFADTSITVPVTNSQGLVEALFYNTQTDEILLPSSAIIQAVTRGPDGNPQADTVTIPLRRVHNALSMQAIPNVVIGDGASSVNIRAFLLDTDGHGIVGDTIRFSNPTHDGSIAAIAVTNDNGIAINTFSPFAGVDSSILAEILAEYRPGSPVHQASATTNVTVTPVHSIGYLTVSLQKQSIVADGIDSSSIFITVQDSSGGLIADGTPIHLENTGRGFLSTTQVTTVDGQARAKITSPLNINGPANVRVDSIFINGQINDTTEIQAIAVVNYIPGSVHQIYFVYPESSITMVAGSGDTSSMIIYAVDANGNPVANGTQITFKNTLDSLSSLTPRAAGTADGYARSTYLIGAGTGDDNITGWIVNPSNPNDTIRTVHPVVVRCLSSEATTLSLRASQANIQVGGQSTQIIATLQDAYGNPLSEGYYVAFDITVAPIDSMGRKPSFDSQFQIQHDTVATNINGQAVIQLYSGIKAGAVSIRACTIPLPPDSLYVCNEKSLVTISSGPPRYISISFSYLGEAVNPNTPERYVQVGAIVGDRYSNPVQYGTAVYFSLLPSDIGDIEGDSYTGGARSYHPDSTNGVAYSRIIYSCFKTFDTVQVIASSAGDSAEIIDTSAAYPLPIFEGEIGLTAVPGALWTIDNSCNHTDTSWITATLTDGGGCPVEGGIITFTAQVAGEIIGQSVDTTDVSGHAYTIFMIRGCQIPTLQNGQSIIDAQVKAVLAQKTSVFAVVTITCTRP